MAGIRSISWSLPGATRLFIGNMDAYEWSNDIGSFSIMIHNPSTVKIVQ